MVKFLHLNKYLKPMFCHSTNSRFPVYLEVVQKLHYFRQIRKYDMTPLKKLIEKNCDFSQIQKNLDERKYESIVVTANNYIQGGAVSFVQTPQVFNSERLNWGDTRRKPIKTLLDSSHILASSKRSSIPSGPCRE